MADKIEVHAQQDIITNGHSVYVVKGDQIFRMELVQFVRGASVDPSIGARQGTEFLKAALDCAWALGLRPDGFSDTTEQVRAMDRHLQDMRAITFAKLSVEKPNG